MYPFFYLAILPVGNPSDAGISSQHIVIVFTSLLMILGRFLLSTPLKSTDVMGTYKPSNLWTVTQK